VVVNIRKISDQNEVHWGNEILHVDHLNDNNEILNNREHRDRFLFVYILKCQIFDVDSDRL